MLPLITVEMTKGFPLRNELEVPPTYYAHPEFGYFCPSRGARRELRVAVVSMLFGMVIGAAVATVGAGHAGDSDGASSNAQPKSSRSDTLLQSGNGPTAQFMTAGNAQANSVEAIKPFPMRRVRVPTKPSALARIPLDHTAQPEPPRSAGPTSHENEQAALSPPASPQARKVEAAAQSATPITKRRPSSIYARRRRDDENENARRQSWGERAYAEDRSWRGAYRNWVYW
jgi:hypothetical protein